MGFSLYYRTVQRVSAEKAVSIQRAAAAANERRSWLSCEPVQFNPIHIAGHLEGGSKHNFSPSAEDAAAARREELPDGTARDLIDILCTLSREHGVDWEIRHDAVPGPIGIIRRGIGSAKLLEQVDALADVTLMLGSIEDDYGDELRCPTQRRPSGGSMRDGDDESDPPILRLWTAED